MDSSFLFFDTEPDSLDWKWLLPLRGTGIYPPLAKIWEVTLLSSFLGADLRGF
jgi:hypothetical protein